MKKEVYSQPVSEIFELKLLGSVLQTVSPNGYNNQGGGGTYTEEDTNDNGGY